MDADVHLFYGMETVILDAKFLFEGKQIECQSVKRKPILMHVMHRVQNPLPCLLV